MKGSFKLLESIRCLFRNVSDSKNYFGFLVDEISELRYTIRSLCSRHLEILKQKTAENLTQTNELMNISIYFSNLMRIFYACLEMPSGS